MNYPNHSRTAKILFLALSAIACFLLYDFYLTYRSSIYLQDLSVPQPKARTPKSPTKLNGNGNNRLAHHTDPKDVTLVVAKTIEESVDWVFPYCEKYRCTPYIYSLDDEPEEGFLIPYTNRGHEAEHWHNDVAGPKTLNQLPILRMQAVQHFGYVNLRCLRRPGCPSSLRQDIIQQSDVENQNLVDNFDLIWTEIMGTRSGPPPDNIGHMCCGQFAVAKEIILNKPISDYERFVDWVAKTQWSENYGIGWMMEKLWHIIFQMPANHCTDELQCRCDLYGWCGPNPLTGGVVLKPVGS